MRITISLVTVLFAWLALFPGRTLCQCPEPTESMLEILMLEGLWRAATEGGGGVESVAINDFNINCLQVEEV